MMDWCIGHDVGDTFSPQGYFDRLPSPDSWSNWGINGFGNPGWPNNIDNVGNMVSDFSDERPNQLDAEISYGSSYHGGSSEESQPWNPATRGCPDLQFQDLTGTDPIDAMFLSSLLHDDAPTTTVSHNSNSVGIPSQSAHAVSTSHSNSAERMSEFQSKQCDADVDGGSKFCRTPSFSPSAGSDDGYFTVPNVGHENSLDQSHTQSVKALDTMDMLLSDQEAGGEDSSIEESVLLGLEAVLSQLSSKTRLCFRDSLYRLAQRLHVPTSSEVSVEVPSLNRTERTATGESETNTIDRAVANLMFQNPNDHCRCT